jgi:hypothetical protein
VASNTPSGRTFYLAHKQAIREATKNTKIHIVYDASVKASPSAPSLNECLYPGPLLQNKLWDVFFPVAVFSDLEKAFLQIRIKQQERDAL